ncbi:MAG: hypothetical protein R3220_02180 [Balneolaceae bacterium]|nr:hypothetical protein [Balneolaceae bacterium]
MNHLLLKMALLILFGTGLSGCMVSGGVIIDPEPVIIGDPPTEVVRRSKYHKKGKRKHFKIPPGHMPPPGECRIWYYDRPPGHQPPTVQCHRVRRIPYGAILVRG